MILGSKLSDVRYQNLSFGNDGRIAEQYFARMMPHLADREVVEFYIMQDGKKIEYIKVRRVAILYYVEPENIFRSDVALIRNRAKKFIKAHPDAEFGVNYYKEAKGIASKLGENIKLHK